MSKFALRFLPIPFGVAIGADFDFSKLWQHQNIGLLVVTVMISTWFTPAFGFADTDYVTRIQADEMLDEDIIDWIFNSPLANRSTASQKLQLNLSDETLDQEFEKLRAVKSKLIKHSKKRKLSSLQLKRQANISRCLSVYFRIPVDAEQWRPWTIMHGLLPYGQISRVKSKGQFFTAVDYLCHNGIGNDTLMLHLAGNSLGVSVGPGVQGHEGQFLAMLAQADTPIDQPIYIQGRKFTVADLVEYEKRSCRQATELTFKLIGLSHYLDSDEIWRSDIGQNWNIERLIHEEIKQPINGAACGGTHRLMGLSYAVKKRAQSDRPVNGEWGRAQNYISQYQKYALQYQNPDGSFSTNWFVTQEAEIDLKKRLYTTGHIVEWLALSLPDDEIDNPQLAHAIDYLTNLMVTAPALNLEIGPRGHAIHALRLYEKRIFGSNSDVEAIHPHDLVMVEKALVQQKNMKPEFELNSGPTGQSVAFPGNTTPFKRRAFRRR